MKYQRGFTITEVLIVAILALGFGGWVANIVKLVGMNMDVFSGMLIVRAVGIFFAPLGAILGFI